MSLARYFSLHSYINWEGSNNTAKVTLVSLCTQVWGHLGILEEKARQAIVTETNADKAVLLLAAAGFKALEGGGALAKKVAFGKVCRF